jgi:hypothetical protein
MMSGFYAMLAGASDVYLVKDDLVINLLTQKEGDFRDLTIFSGKVEEVNDIVIQEGKKKATLVRNPQGMWLLMPQGRIVPQDQVERLLKQFKNPIVNRTVAIKPKKMIAYGLHKPKMLVKFKLTNDTTEQFAFGTASGNSVYLYPSETQTVYEVSNVLTKMIKEIRSTGNADLHL